MAFLKKFRALYRLLFFAAYTSLRISQIIITNWIRGENFDRSMRIRKSWARFLLPRIGISIEVSGVSPEFPCLLMCNHRSYLDPVLIIFNTVACPVSKAEVSGWPVIGYGASVSGVIFLKRESTNSRKRTLAAISDTLAAGHSVILFPEGTTHADPQCHDFKPGGFKLAAQALVPVVPVAIEFGSKEDYWVGNDTFLPHFFRRFSEKKIRAWVHYGTAIQSEDPEYLLNQSQNWINRELKDIQKSFSG